MKNDALQKATKFKKDHQRKKRWYRIVTSLAAVVVFCTVYALILPAITMERGKCEIPEHTHTEECYTKILPGRELICTPESLGVHEHTDDCYDDEGELICGSADFVVHKHNELCYDEDGELVCQFPEILVHTHSNSCFEKPDKAEWKLFRHIHNDDCYSVTQGALICDADTEETEEESTETATDSNATEKKTVTHHHTDSCYEWEKELICEKATEKEEKTEKGELICAEEAIALHKHSKKCYDSLGNLKCEKLEVLEHVHTDECFRSMGDAADPDELTCGLEENENHTHSALCYGTWVLTCEKEEHTHTLACYSDPTVDVESPSNWEATLPDTMTGEWRIDVLRVAESQLGYMESTENYEVEEDGTTTRGYTRYGEWYGDPYGDWCAMFTSFCLHYADVPEEIFPQDADCANWISKLESMEDPEQESGMLYRPAEADNTEEAYVPAAGDLVFFDKDGDDGADHVGLVAELITGTDGTVSQIRTIEGNSENKVRHVTYEAKDPKILGYGVLPDQGFTCKKTGHIHKASCRDSHGELICDMDEHIHTEECKKILTELSYSGADYTVSVVYGEEAGLPEGVILQAEEIPADSEEYEKYYNEAVAAVEAETEKAEAAEEAETIEETDKDREDSEEITDDAKAEEVLFARFFDIRFLYEGEEIEPEAPVTVTITYADPVETGEQVTCQAVHFGSEGTEVLEVETQSTEENNTSFTHTQNSFSVVG
ncbi:MAG: CHAP domain-containing protein, partial [Lachnospiraceae bacterium]|nr:CHAP domain-containing protein [Lachnospiraceae bacterium]